MSVVQPPTPAFHSKRLVYKAASSTNVDDVQFINEVQSDPLTLMRQTPAPPKPWRQDQGASWLKHHDSQMASWMICLPQDPPPVTGLVDPQIDYDKLVRIGWIALNANGNAANRKCNLGMVLHKDYQGKGYGTEAVKHAIRYAFVSANQRRIELDAFLWNEPAIKAYTKCGFTIEGVKKESVWFQGRFYDEGIMAIMRRDWAQAEGLALGALQLD